MAWTPQSRSAYEASLRRVCAELYTAAQLADMAGDEMADTVLTSHNHEVTSLLRRSYADAKARRETARSRDKSLNRRGRGSADDAVEGGALDLAQQ